MAREASEAGVPYMRYPPDEAEEDLRTIASWEEDSNQAGDGADNQAADGADNEAGEEASGEDADGGDTVEENSGQDPADPDTG